MKKSRNRIVKVRICLKKYQSINLSQNDKINAFKRELQKLVRPFTIFVCTARNSDSMNNIKNFAMES